MHLAYIPFFQNQFLGRQIDIVIVYWEVTRMENEIMRLKQSLQKHAKTCVSVVVSLTTRTDMVVENQIDRVTNHFLQNEVQKKNPAFGKLGP